MSHDAPEKARKKILVLSGLLGFMFGVGAVLVFVVVQRGNYTLLLFLLAILITAIPLVKELVELLVEVRRARAEEPSPDTRPS